MRTAKDLLPGRRQVGPIVERNDKGRDHDHFLGRQAGRQGYRDAHVRERTRASFFRMRGQIDRDEQAFCIRAGVTSTARHISLAMRESIRLDDPVVSDGSFATRRYRQVAL